MTNCFEDVLLHLYFYADMRPPRTTPYIKANLHYYAKVSVPIDFSTIGTQLEMEGGGYDSVPHMLTDVVRVLTNAQIGYKKDSDEYNRARTLLAAMKEKCKMVLSTEDILSCHFLDKTPSMVIKIIKTLLDVLDTGVDAVDAVNGGPPLRVMPSEKEWPEYHNKANVVVSYSVIKENFYSAHYATLKDFATDVNNMFAGRRTVVKQESPALSALVACQQEFLDAMHSEIAKHKVETAASVDFTKEKLEAELKVENGLMTAALEREAAAKEKGEEVEALLGDLKRRQREEENGEGPIPPELRTAVAEATSTMYDGTAYTVGEYIYTLNHKVKGGPLMLNELTSVFTDASGKSCLTATKIYRPDDTYHLASKTFFKQEAFRSNETIIEEFANVVRKCCVLCVRDYCGFTVLGIPDEDVFVCEARYSSKQRQANKIKSIQKPPDEKIITLIPREIKLDGRSLPRVKSKHAIVVEDAVVAEPVQDPRSIPLANTGVTTQIPTPVLAPAPTQAVVAATASASGAATVPAPAPAPATGAMDTAADPEPTTAAAASPTPTVAGSTPALSARGLQRFSLLYVQGKAYSVGNFVFLPAKGNALGQEITRIDEMWVAADGMPFLKGPVFVEPKNTIREGTLFYPGEVVMLDTTPAAEGTSMFNILRKAHVFHESTFSSARRLLDVSVSDCRVVTSTFTPGNFPQLSPLPSLIETPFAKGAETYMPSEDVLTLEDKTPAAIADVVKVLPTVTVQSASKSGGGSSRSRSKSKPKSTSAVAKELTAVRQAADTAKVEMHRFAIRSAALAAQHLSLKMGGSDSLHELLGDFSAEPKPPEATQLFIEDHRAEEHGADTDASYAEITALLHERYKNSSQDVLDQYEEKSTKMAEILTACYKKGKSELEKLLPTSAVAAGIADGSSETTPLSQQGGGGVDGDVTAVDFVQSHAARAVLRSESKRNPTKLAFSTVYTDHLGKSNDAADVQKRLMAHTRVLPPVVAVESLELSLEALARAMNDDVQALSHLYMSSA